MSRETSDDRKPVVISGGRWSVIVDRCRDGFGRHVIVRIAAPQRRIIAVKFLPVNYLTAAIDLPVPVTY